MTTRKSDPSVQVEWWGAREAEAAERTIREQRPRRAMYVEHIAQAMVRGEWRLSNDAIAFISHPGDHDYAQCNGQHRTIGLLRANVLEPGIRVPFLVVKGLTQVDAQTFDQGRLRTLADTLDFLDGPTTDPGHRPLAALVNLAWHVDQDTWSNRTPVPTRTQQIDFLKQHPEMVDIVEPAQRLNKELHGGLPGYGVGVWQASLGSHAAKLGEFIEQVATGELLKQNDPAYQLRKAISVAREPGRVVGGERSIRGWWIAAMFVHAWNDFVRNEAPGKLPVMRRTDPFPTAA